MCPFAALWPEKTSSKSKALKMIWWPVSLSQLQIYKADSECCRWVHVDVSTHTEVTDDIQPNLQVSPSFSSADQHRGDENRAGLRRQQKYPQKTSRKQEWKCIFTQDAVLSSWESFARWPALKGLMHFFWSNTDVHNEHTMCRWWKYERTCHLCCVLCVSFHPGPASSSTPSALDSRGIRNIQMCPTFAAPIGETAAVCVHKYWLAVTFLCYRCTERNSLVGVAGVRSFAQTLGHMHDYTWIQIELDKIIDQLHTHTGSRPRLVPRITSATYFQLDTGAHQNLQVL